jgi:hypothetical protein
MMSKLWDGLLARIMPPPREVLVQQDGYFDPRYSGDAVFSVTKERHYDRQRRVRVIMLDNPRRAGK